MKSGEENKIFRVGYLLVEGANLTIFFLCLCLTDFQLDYLFHKGKRQVKVNKKKIGISFGLCDIYFRIKFHVEPHTK